MSRISRLLARIYPAPWRRRYGPEFEALIEDSGAGWKDAIDVAKGAVMMHSIRWSVIVAGFTLIGALAGVGASFLMPPMYVSSSSIAVRGASGPDAGRAINETVREALSRKTLTSILQSRGLYPSELLTMPLEDVIEKMRRHIKIAMSSRSEFVISFAYPDRLKAQTTTAMLVAEIITAHLRQGAAIPTTVPAAGRTTFEVIDPPSLPQRAVNPYLIHGILIGIAAGLLTGAIVVRVRRQPAMA